MNTRRSIPLIVVVLVLLSLVLTSSGALAQAGTTGVTIPYSSRLTDETGQPVADGKYDVQFALYDAELGGQLLWSETQVGITVQSGALNVSLGAVIPMPTAVSMKKELWLAVSVRGPQDKDFTLLNPRQSFNGPAAATALTCVHSHFTDNWTGTSTGYGLRVENTGVGDGIRAFSNSTSNSYAAIWAENRATTGAGTAVYADSDRGLGVYAYSGLSDAIEAVTFGPSKSAVYAHTSASGANGVWATSSSGYGVYGSSVTNDGIVGLSAGAAKSGVYGANTITASVGYGVFGRALYGFGLGADGKDTSGFDLLGDLYLAGTRGEILTYGSIMNVVSNGSINLEVDNDNNSVEAFRVWNGADAVVFTVDESGNTTATGAKSASVKTADYGQRLLYSMESPEVWLEDFGSALLVNGTATVKVESIFAETANLNEDYHVFLTPLGDCALYVAEKAPASFTVKAIGGQTCSIAFDYRLVAKRLGYETTRLAPAKPASGEMK